MNRILFIALGIAVVAGDARADKQRTLPAPPVRVRDGETIVLGSVKRLIVAKQYQIDLKLVEVKEDTDVNALAIKVHPHPFKAWDGRGHQFTRLDCAKCHSSQGQANSNDFFWKTFLDQRHYLKTWAGNSKGVKVLASPTLVTTAGRAANFSAKSPRKVQYFQRLKPDRFEASDGRFVLKDEKVETGISVKATVQPADDGHVRLKPLTVSVTAIKGREPIPGVTLPVGKPVLTTTSISTSVLAKLGKSSVISIDSPRGGRVLISVRVSQPVRKTTATKRVGTDDVEFLRRITLDLTGKLPTAEQTKKFLSDKSPDKRRRLVNWLLNQKR